MAKWLFGSMKRRVLVMFLSIVLVLSLVIIGVTGLFSRALVDDLIEQNASALVLSQAQQVETWKQERMHELEQLANSPILETGDWDQIEPYLQGQIQNSPDYYKIFFLATPDGNYNTTLQRSAGNIRDRSYFEPVMAGETLVSEPVISQSTGEKIVVVATPVWNESKSEVMALLGLSVSLEHMYQSVTDLDLSYPDSDVFIVNSDGVFLTHSNPDLILEGRIHDYIPQWDEIKKQDASKVTYWFNDVEYRAFLSKLSPQWSVVMQVPRAYFKKPVQKLMYRLLIIGVICVFLVLRLGIWFANNITSPIVELKDIFKQGSEGDLTVRAEVETTDELGETRAYFNRMMDRIGTMTYFDPVTNLPNRQFFLDHLKNCLTENPTVILVLIAIRDLSELKTLLGPEITDEALNHVARILKTLGQDDLVIARVSDSEFGIIIPSTTSGVLRVVDRLEQILVKPLHLEKRNLSIRLFGGITISEHGIEQYSAEQIYQQAQSALFEAEHSLTEQLKLYNPETHNYLRSRVQFQAEIRRALQQEEFTVFYQPIIDLKKCCIIGKEALIRWNHPERGLLAPGEFLEVAEQGGFIEEIGEYMLSRVCAQHRHWHDKGLDLGWVTVNISAKHFQMPDFPVLVQAILQTCGQQLGLLKIEVTEDAMLSPSPQVLSNLDELRQLGVPLAIDDFGTAYSTLEYLIKYPMETLKIDKTFINSLDKDPRTQGLVRSIIGMGQNLSMRIIAEGVERREQVKLLQDMGCNEMQGYFFSHPIPWEDYPKTAAELSLRLGRNGLFGENS